MKNKAKKVRKVTEKKKYPILEKEKRQKLDSSQIHESPISLTDMKEPRVTKRATVNLEEYFHEYNEKKKKIDPEDK